MFLIFFQKHFVSATNVSQFAQPKKHHEQQSVRNKMSSFASTLNPHSVHMISLRSKRSCAFLAKRKPRISERTSLGRAKIGESAKNEARGRGRGEKGTLASNHRESQIRPLCVARFSDFDEMTTVENTQSKLGGRNTGGSKQTIVPCESSVKKLHVSSKVFTDLQIIVLLLQACLLVIFLFCKI